jgi:menaquinone-dependent protoporphyrinogen oxidase
VPRRVDDRADSDELEHIDWVGVSGSSQRRERDVSCADEQERRADGNDEGGDAFGEEGGFSAVWKAVELIQTLRAGCAGHDRRCCAHEPVVCGGFRRDQPDAQGRAPRHARLMTETTQQGATDQPSQRSEAQRTLVAYASRFGSTRGVADRIAAGLRARGLPVDLRSVEECIDLSLYDAVVFGSAVYDQRWAPAGQAFVRRNLGALTGRPVWLFSVGTFGDSKRLIGPLMRREPKDIGALEDVIRPRGYRVFAGVIDRHQWPFVSRLFFHAFGGRLGDNRDWPAIDAWTDSIARALGAAAMQERGESR